MVALPWGSRSISNPRFRRAASAAARLIAVVVLPTPPFWLAMQNMLAELFAFIDFLDDSSTPGNAGRPALAHAAVPAWIPANLFVAAAQPVPRPATGPSWLAAIPAGPHASLPGRQNLPVRQKPGIQRCRRSQGQAARRAHGSLADSVA